MTNIPASFLPGASNFSTAAATETIPADRALYLKLFSGEMFKGFQHNTIARDLIMRRTLTNGRSMQFIFTGRLGAEYHTRGTPILGNADGAPPVAEKTITVDDLLVSSAFVYELDEVLAHYDLRSEIARKIGYALAEKYDRLAFRAIAKGARQQNPVQATDYEEPGGTQVQVGTGAGALNDAYNSSKLITAFFDAAAALDEKGVSQEGRVGVLSPRQYYALLQEKDSNGIVSVSPLINRDRGGDALQSGQGVLAIAGIKIYKSMNIPFFNRYGVDYTNLPTGTTAPGNVGDFVGAAMEAATADETGGNDYGEITDVDTSGAIDGQYNTSCGLIFQREAAGMVEAIGPQVQTTSGDVSVIYQGDVMLGRLACGADYLNPAAAVELFATNSAPTAF